MQGERLKEGRGKEVKKIKKSNRNGKKDELLHGDKKKGNKDSSHHMKQPHGPNRIKQR